MVTVGVIGCGKIAVKRHIPEYLHNPNVRITGFYNPTIEKAEEQAGLHGGKVYGTIEELLDDKRIDAVSVCLANIAHAKVSIQALNAGKHVLCEKPMATNMADCIRMTEAAERQDRCLMIAHNQRLSKCHIMAKRLLKAGVIGKVLTFSTMFGHGGPESRGIALDKPVWFFDKKQAAMGVMADLGIHKLDLLQYLLDQEVVQMNACTATLDKKDGNGIPIDVEDNALCIIRMSKGAMGTMTVSWTHYGREDNSTVLYGTEGVMRIPGIWGGYLLVEKKNGEELQYDIEEEYMEGGLINSGVIDEFIEAIQEDRQPLISGRDVLASMQMIFSSMNS